MLLNLILIRIIIIISISSNLSEECSGLHRGVLIISFMILCASCISLWMKIENRKLPFMYRSINPLFGVITKCASYVILICLFVNQFCCSGLHNSQVELRDKLAETDLYLSKGSDVVLYMPKIFTDCIDIYQEAMTIYEEYDKIEDESAKEEFILEYYIDTVDRIEGIKSNMNTVVKLLILSIILEIISRILLLDLDKIDSYIKE